MAAGISTIFPPAGQKTPGADQQEKALLVLREELSKTEDKSLAALLMHEMARLHERRDDLAAAAREELAATKYAAGFVEPLESLISIATRSRSRSNLTKLLERLGKLVRDDQDFLRTQMALIAIALDGSDDDRARTLVEEALEKVPDDPTSWLVLEILALRAGDSAMLKRAAIGRTAHARGSDLRSLLLERVARLHQADGDHGAALDSVKQSVDERPTWRALHAWELLALAQDNYQEASLAASQSASIQRAALSEPDEAPLYAVPVLELNESRVQAAHFRSALYSALDGDLDEAVAKLAELLEQSPRNQLALAAAATLAARTNDRSGLLRAQRRLLEEAAESAENTAFAATTLLLSGCEPNDHAEAVASLLRTAPNTMAARVLRWGRDVQAAHELLEQGQRSDALRTVRQAIAELFPDEPGLPLAEAVSCLLLGQPETALDRLGDTNPSSAEPSLAAVLVHALTQARGTGENVPSPPAAWATSAEEKAQLDWADRRLAFLETGHFGPSNAGLPDQGWLRLLFRLIDRDAPSGTALAEFLEDGLRPELRRSLAALATMLTPRDGEPTVPRLEEHAAPNDALLLGDELGRALGPDGAIDPETLLRLAEKSEDETLQSGWALRALLVSLGRGDQDEARKILKRFKGLDPELAATAHRWLRFSSLDDDPARTLTELEAAHWPRGRSADDDSADDDSAADDGADDDSADSRADDDDESPLLERRLDLLFLSHRLRRPTLKRMLEFVPEFEPTERLFVALAAASDETLGEFPTDVPLIAQEQTWSLSAARGTKGRGSALLTRLERDQRVSASAYFTRWVLARHEKDREHEARALMALALHLDDPLLLLQVEADSLTPELKAERTRLLRSKLSAATNDNGPRGAEPSLQGAIAWTLCEETPEDEEAAALRNLAQVVDPDLLDSDAQLACLCAGYKHLMEEDFEEALACLEPLLEVIPSDPTLCQGLRLAAQRTKRTDLEARVTCELARHAPDNRTSAELWERAGLLYQDGLEDEQRAEECFQAALSRHPGSALSFDRLYRFARKRRDRPRQVDLIDARLSGAESETLQIELLWEKTRFCRLLGRRDEAQGSVEELLELAPDHLPALALSAELFLKGGLHEKAASALRDIALHPDTPPTEKRSAGAFACDLLEKLGQARRAFELLESLEAIGVHTNASLLRKGRALAKSGDFGAAYDAFLALNNQQDEVEDRRESAKVLLALQRDHLKDRDALRDATTRVLRDDPLDRDAIDIVLGWAGAEGGSPVSFSSEQHRRLLTPARESSLRALRANPLDAGELNLYAHLCQDSGDATRERIAWGMLALTGASDATGKLVGLREKCPSTPSHSLAPTQQEALLGRDQKGALGEYARLLAPLLARALEPSLEALGVRTTMQVDLESTEPRSNEIRAWASLVGLPDLRLFVGGFDGRLIRGLNLDHPTLVLGTDLSYPLTRIDAARVAAQLLVLKLGTTVFLNHPPATLSDWCQGSALLAQGKTSSTQGDAVNELARGLGHVTDRATRERLAALLNDLDRTTRQVTSIPDAQIEGAARAATFAFGDPSIVRELGEYLPSDEHRRNEFLEDLIRFCLSNDFSTLRKRAGLEGA